MKNSHLIIFIISFLMFSSCMDSGGRKGLTNIQNYSKDLFSPKSEFCSDYTRIEYEVCYETCPKNTRIGTNDEVVELISEHSKTYPDINQARQKLFDIYENAKGICIDDIKRPNKEITINDNYCACHLNKPFIANNCEQFCSTRYDPTPTLIANVTVSDKVKNDPLLGNLYNWCTVEIGDGNYSPSCQIEINDGQFTNYQEIEIFPNSNNFKTNLSFLENSKTYTLKIIESTSMATTSTIQIRRMNNNPTNITPLTRTSISQYTCITTSGYILNGQNFYEHTARLHYYFEIGNTPDPLPPGNEFFYCHDKNLGKWDSPLYPRLELINSNYMLWNKTDTRFFDGNGDKKLDINKEIEDRLTTPSTINLFQPLTYSTGPSSGDKLLGFYLQSFIDNNQIPYCPTSVNFTQGSEIFKILADYIDGDTEALYMAKREYKILKDQNGNITTAPDDYIFIRESELKKIWFYKQNSTLIKHNDATSRNHSIMFFYPADTNYPLTQKDYQSIYTIINPTEFDPLIPRPGIWPSDKRLGCIPK